MAFWDNFSQKASETTAKAMQKAKEMSDIAKLNSMISEEETKINNTYYQIGKLYVAMHSHDYEEEFVGMITTIGEADEKIKNYKQQVQDIKGVACCAQCGAEVQAGVAFCSSCGAPMPKVQQTNTEDFVVTVDKPCDWCSNRPSVAYKTSDGSYAYVCRKCSKTCKLCGEKADRHYENLIGTMVFVCDDCYKGLQ